MYPVPLDCTTGLNMEVPGVCFSQTISLPVSSRGGLAWLGEEGEKRNSQLMNTSLYRGTCFDCGFMLTETEKIRKIIIRFKNNTDSHIKSGEAGCCAGSPEGSTCKFIANNYKFKKYILTLENGRNNNQSNIDSTCSVKLGLQLQQYLQNQTFTLQKHIVKLLRLNKKK